MQPDQPSDAVAGGQQAGGKGGLKQGLYLQQQRKYDPKQQPLAYPAGGALAANAAGVLHAATYRRSSVEDGKGPAAGRAVLAGAAGAAAGAGLLLVGQRSPAGAHQQQPHMQLPQLQPNKRQERVADADTAAAAFEHALQPRQAGRAASAGAAVSTAAGASPGVATGVFADRGLATWSAGHHPATTTTSSSKPPSGKLPALQQQPSPLQQLQHAPAAAAAILTGRGGTAACVPGSTGRSKQQLAQQRQQQLLPQQQRHQVSRDPYTDPEVQQRTAAWVKLMQDMQQGSDGAQFVYLRYAWLHQLPFNPFDLEVCSHAEAVASGRYFTMSPSGVTAYSADGSRPEFSSLAQWQREWQLHSRLMQMPVFRQHKLWKAFSMWRRAIWDLKSSSSTEKLSKGLLLLDPQLQQAVYAVRAACLEVEAVQLSCLVPGQALTLLQYAEEHAAQLDRCQAHLAQVCAEAVATAAAASERSLAALQQEMLGVAGAVVGADLARARGSSSDAEPNKPKKGQTAAAAAAVAAAAVPVQLINDSYAMQAARRAQRRRLCDMIRLLDYMLSDAIHSLLLQSLRQMLRCMHGAGQAAQPAAQQEQPTDPSCSLLQTQQQQQKGQQGVVLRLELLLHEQEDQLYLQPHAGEFVEGLGVWLRSVERAVRGVPRLLSSDALQPFLEMTSDSASSRSPDSLAHQMLGADFEHLSKSLEASMQSALAAVQHYTAGYEAFRDMVVTNRAFTAAAVQQAVDARQLGLTGLRQLLWMYEQQLADVTAIPSTVNVGVVQVCLSRLVDALVPSPQRCIQELRQLLPRLAADAYNTFITRVRGYNEHLSRQPGNPEEFVAHAALIAEVEGARPDMDKEYDLVTGFYELLQEFSIQAPAEDLAAAACVDADYVALRDTAWAAEAAKERHAEEFRYQLEQQAAALAKEVSKLRAEGEQEVFLTESAELTAMIEATGKLLAQVMTQQAAASHLSALSVECGGTPLVLEELEALAEETGLKAMLWAMQQEMREAAAAWMSGPLFGLDVADMQAKVDQFSRQVHKLERGLTPNDLVPKLRQEVNRWQEILGPVGHLRNPLLRERHWQAIANLLGHSIDHTEGAATNIQQLLNRQVLDHKEALAAISNEAVQVAALEEMLAAVADKWRNVEFVVKRVKAAKDNFILGEVDDVMQVLEDSKITISMILSSRYVSGIKSEVDRMDRQLQLFSATLESWLVLQRGWLKLEAVFGAPDILRQVPGEAAAFAQVDKAFKDIMRRTHDRPNALQCGTTPGWLEAFDKCAATLEAVQKGLEDYLETKRVAFPRFYFLSNEELLDILRQAKNPQAVQPHLPKCFEGMRCLLFAPAHQLQAAQSTAAPADGSSRGVSLVEGPPPAAPPAASAVGAARLSASGPAEGRASLAGEGAVLGLSNEILAMLSPEGEQVAFGRVLKARGLVESWLASVESNMRLTLKGLAKKALKDYCPARRPAWALAQPAQLALLAASIHWCQDVEAALQSNAAGVQLRQLHGRCMLQLEDLVELIRSPLSDLERKAVVALITADVHNRDVVGTLIQKGTASTNDFAWQQQLRFEFDPDADSILVRQVNARFPYGYEYLGASNRLVVTPMTDRCFLTLTGALALRLGGAPSGPAGTGKTESVKDLGKALGMQCVVFNCSDNLDHVFMGKFFRGLAQCGAWACLDEFNRMELEVLSVVAQQLHALQSALRCGADKLLLDGRDLALQASCGVFVTQNPGYAGRTELPDNLKVLFRPIAMTAPDYQLIAEVMLFSERFSQAGWLAGKVVHLYKLASQQLSQQAHYDFGMRALKAVLMMAGGLKRCCKQESEEVVVIRALREANLPKLLTDDIVLFESIISDLFPDTQLPEADSQQLSDALDAACWECGLQPQQAFLGKALQLHDTLGVRFGVMLVGPAGGGKTACYRSLQVAQTSIMQAAPLARKSAAAAPASMADDHSLADQGADSSSLHVGVQAHVLNPKSVSLAELYGSFNVVTNEWTDGLASRMIRAAVADSSAENMHWVVFDGAVDPGWVESMNTALDDNRMLCLPSGERIRLDESRLRLLFEVEDLAAASPATVSRCGMVYMPADVLGWRPAARSWLDQYLSRHATLAAAQPSEGGSQPAAVGPDALPPSAEASQLESPTSPAALPGFGRDGFNSFKAGRASAGGGRCAAAKACDSQCPEGLLLLREFIWGMVERFCEPLLAWVAEKGMPVVQLSGATLMASVTTLLEVQLSTLHKDGLPVLDPGVSKAQAVLLQYVFAYAAVWGIGGCLAVSCWDAWDKVARGVFEGCANYPSGAGTVFDYFVDTRGSAPCFSRWDTVVPAFTFKQQQPMHALMVPTVDTCRYGALLQGCLAAGKPVLLVGGSGVAKSAIIKERIEALRGQLGGKLESAVLNCCAFTSSAAAQQLLESNLVKRGHSLGPPAGHRLAVFIDDVHLPEREQYGAVPALEMLRLLLDRAGLYQRKTLAWRRVLDTVLVAAAGTSAGGRQGISRRLTRHMVTLAVPPPSEGVLRSICTAVLGGFLASCFTPDVHSCMLRPLVDGCVEVYTSVCSSLLPTPSKSHYSFNLRDMSRVLGGILSIAPPACGGDVPAALTRLWVHEVQRVFGDRLVCEEDRALLRQLQQELLVSKFGWAPGDCKQQQARTTAANPSAAAPPKSLFGSGLSAQACVASDALFDGPEQVLFGDFAKMGISAQERVYEPLAGMAKLAGLLERYLDECNISGGKAASAAAAAAAEGGHHGDGKQQGRAAAGRDRGARMDLVFFQDAVLHVVRLARVLRQPRGCALLVGVGGSGKQSLAKFAAFVADCDVRTISMSAGYNLARFREEVKHVLKVAGVEGRHIVLLLTDNNITDEAMLADVNGLLNTGEVTGLFTPEEQALLLDQLHPWLTTQPEMRPGRAVAWEAFIHRARHHLHIVFATSPAGTAFRTRCRQFPSLVNCMTVDWFSQWPDEALLGVGVRVLEGLDLGAGAASPGGAAAAAPVAGSVQSVVMRVARMCVDIHKGVEAAANRLHQEQQRRCYVTPRSFLDLLGQYAHLLHASRTELGDKRRRLLDGIAKLNETSSTLTAMRSQLNELQPLLAEKTAATSTLLQQVRDEQAEAQSIAATVSAEEAEVAAQAARCKALKDDAAADLAAVLPALQSAVAALDSLNKADIIEMRTFIKPPALVQLTMEGVCILLQEKTDWDAAKRVMSDAAFITRLIEYDKDSISEKVRRELRRIISDPAFTPDQVGQQSKAAMSMCLWVRAVDTYATVYRIVEPKRKILAQAQADLDAIVAALAQKQQQLQALKAKVAALQQLLTDTQKQLAALQFQAELCNKRLGRAGKLTNLLGDELVRWGATAAELGGRLDLLVGDALLAAAVVNYLGPFPGAYRSQLLPAWCAGCRRLGIPASSPFSLSEVLSNPVELLEWSLQGLPSDTVSVDNGLIVTRGIRRPLIIDPQQQCTRWIKLHKAGQGLVTARGSDPNLLRVVEGAVRLGTPLLLDDLPEGSLPPGLEGLLQPVQEANGKPSGPHIVHLGGAPVEVAPSFRLYLVTRLANPTYLPEASTLVNLVNFAITRQGLEEQLLAELVRAECPELEESRDSLTTSISADKKQLQVLEGKILRLLREATNNLLDDEVLISTLNTSKETSAVIQSRVREAEMTQVQINRARDEYRLPPAEAARLWFLVADLAALHPMYTASLAGFTGTIRHCIKAAPAAATLEGRMEGLVTFLYRYVHRVVSRWLMHTHKLVFGFAIAAAGQRERGAISQQEWELFTRAGALAGAAVQQQAGAPDTTSVAGAGAGGSSRKAPAWCKTGMLEALLALESALPQQLQGLCQAVGACSGADTASWQHLLLRGSLDDFMPPTLPKSTGSRSSCLLDVLLAAAGVGQQQQHDQSSAPAGLNKQGSVEALSPFMRLLLIKDSRMDLLPAAMHAFVSTTLGPSFADPPAAKVSDVFAGSSAATPLVLTVSQGADAVAELGSFAAAHGRAAGRGLLLLSLGQGQGPVAEAMVRVAMRNGDWVCLQNCHLAKSWMPQLVKLVEEIEAAAAAGGGGAVQQGKAATSAASATSSAPAAPSTQGYFLDPSPDPQQQQQQPLTLHPDFRLWLTSSPVDFFPPAVLQKGVRLFLEPPRGLKPTLLSIYASLHPGFLSACDGCGRGRQWRALVFAGALLHGLLCERRRFGPLGWNVPYEFSDGDLSCALSNIQAVVKDPSQELLPTCGSPKQPPSPASSGGSVWDALLHIVGAINYGGRVTDPDDRRLLGGIMQAHLSADVLGGSIRLGRPGAYVTLSAPSSSDTVGCLQELQSLQLPSDPLLFGLHPVAAIASNKTEGRRLLEEVLSMERCSTATAAILSAGAAGSAASAAAGAAEPATVQTPLEAGFLSAAAVRAEAVAPAPAPAPVGAVVAAVVPLEVQMAGVIAQLLRQMPTPLERSQASILHDPFAALPGGRMNPMGVVLLQEMERYNKLLSVVQQSLTALQSACAGLSVLESQEEAALAALSNNQLPAAWAAAAYPSSKPLGSWVADLVRRVCFMRQWLTTGEPAAFWLPGFFFPECFLIAVLQRHALAAGGGQLAIERLALAQVVLPVGGGGGSAAPADCGKAPAVGVYVHGLFLEGARWDAAEGCLADPSPGELFSALPVVHLVPHEAAAAADRFPADQQADSSSSSSTESGGCPGSNGGMAAGQQLYTCPVYKTPARAGVLSSTGQSTNFLMHMRLPMPAGSSQSKWLLQGAAVLCSVDE